MYQSPSLSLYADDEGFSWTFGNEDDDEGVLPALMETASWDVKETLDDLDTITPMAEPREVDDQRNERRCTHEISLKEKGKQQLELAKEIDKQLIR